MAKQLGQETTQTSVAATATLTHYAYDLAGHLIDEFDDVGQLLREYVWLGDQPVAMLTGADTYYIHADHLNSPRVITDANQIIVWRWDNEDPFGATIASEDPDGDGTTVTCNLRFPGQYFDRETGNHYNYFRDYNPETGRYIESDPIGLRGGLNTYGYSLNQPLRYNDPFGLNPAGGCALGALVGGPVGCGAGAIIGTGVLLGAILMTPSDTPIQSRGQSDPVRGQKPFNPGRDCDGKCNKCPPPIYLGRAG